MPIAITCPSCGKSGNAPDAAAGKTITCRSCGERFSEEVPRTSMDRGIDPNAIELDLNASREVEKPAGSSHQDDRRPAEPKPENAGGLSRIDEWKSALLEKRRLIAICGIAALFALAAFMGYQWVAEGNIVYQGKSLREWKGHLKDVGPRVRSLAVTALEEIGKNEHAAVAVSTLAGVASGDSDPFVRGRTVEVIGRIGRGKLASRTIPILLGAIEDDPSPGVREEALGALPNLIYDSKTPNSTRLDVISRMVEILRKQDDEKVSASIVTLIGGLVAREKPPLSSDTTKAAYAAVRDAVKLRGVWGAFTMLRFAENYPQLAGEAIPLACKSFIGSKASWSTGSDFGKLIHQSKTLDKVKVANALAEALTGKRGLNGYNVADYVSPIIIEFGKPDVVIPPLIEAASDGRNSDYQMGDAILKVVSSMGVAALPALKQVLGDQQATGEAKWYDLPHEWWALGGVS